MNLADIETELTEINQFLQAEYTSDASDLCDRLQKANVYLSRTAELKANADYLIKLSNGEKAEEINKDLPDIAPSKFKEILQKYIANESRVFTLADRTNSACSHYIDSVRSVLSYTKQELYNSRFP